MIFAVLFWFSTAQATELHYWKDKDGAMHVVDSSDNVPETFKSNSTVLHEFGEGLTHVHVQLERRGGSLILPVVLNGTIEARMILDTGASQSMIAKRFVDRLHLKFGPDVNLNTAGGQVAAHTVVLDKIAVQGLSVKDLLVSAHDLEQQGVDGLLGTDFLRNFRMKLDPELGTLDLEKK